eukprot:TRINITY_DN7967_c0_g1_i1.p1 TRINITY_DN7967_c0_g1~~TRINITY_DN7967_c0_g1_i1.p1  ORF type:complete len:465 (-),score=114.96 TRINITY_DN7967_c0_g1_i1:120-1514(-)
MKFVGHNRSVSEFPTFKAASPLLTPTGASNQHCHGLGQPGSFTPLGVPNYVYSPVLFNGSAAPGPRLSVNTSIQEVFTPIVIGPPKYVQTSMIVIKSSKKDRRNAGFGTTNECGVHNLSQCEDNSQGKMPRWGPNSISQPMFALRDAAPSDLSALGEEELNKENEGNTPMNVPRSSFALLNQIFESSPNRVKTAKPSPRKRRPAENRSATVLNDTVEIDGGLTQLEGDASLLRSGLQESVEHLEKVISEFAREEDAKAVQLEGFVQLLRQNTSILAESIASRVVDFDVMEKIRRNFDLLATMSSQFFLAPKGTESKGKVDLKFDLRRLLDINEELRLKIRQQDIALKEFAVREARMKAALAKLPKDMLDDLSIDGERDKRGSVTAHAERTTVTPGGANGKAKRAANGGNIQPATSVQNFLKRNLSKTTNISTIYSKLKTKGSFSYFAENTANTGGPSRPKAKNL